MSQVSDTPAPESPQPGKRARSRNYLQSLKPGDKVKATLHAKASFGAFMLVNDIARGLLPLAEMPGDQLEREEFLKKLMPEVDLLVQVHSVDLQKMRVRLTMIAAERQRLFAGFQRGSIVQGTVNNIIATGAFVTLGAISGYLHVRELPGERRERDAALAAMKVGDKLELAVIDVDEKMNRLSLSQRRVAAAQLTAGQEVRGVCVRLSSNFVVLRLNGGVMGYLRRPKELTCEPGQSISASVESVDLDRNSAKLV